MTTVEIGPVQMTVGGDNSGTSPDIVYVGSFRFPHGDAGGTRVLGVGKALRAAGFTVLFAGVENRGHPEDQRADGGFEYQGFRYVPEEDLGSSRLSRLKRAWLTHLSGSTTMRRLHSIDLTRTRAIIAYNPTALLLWRLDSFCRKRHVTLITDCTEWHDPKFQFGGNFGPFRWDSELRTRWVQRKPGQMIAITSFLENHYRERGWRVARIPTLLDLEDFPVVTDDNRNSVGHEGERLRLVFVGSPYRERWDVILDGLTRLERTVHAVRLDVYGISKEDFPRAVGPSRHLLDQLGDRLSVHGRYLRRELAHLLTGAHFSVMLRDDARWSRSCLPTKIPELMAMGIPMLTNAHTDIAEFVRDGTDGIIVGSARVEDFVAALQRVLTMSREDLALMKQNARVRAAECFDYRRYAQPLKEFIADVTRFQSRSPGE